jgi:hypothetical protein
MAGRLVPLVMAPRYTTYSGQGEFATAPLDARPWSRAFVTFFRGPLVGSPFSSPPASFEAVFQTSHDASADSWVVVGAPVTTSGTDRLEVALARRWFRLLVRLVADDTDMVGLTVYAVGALEERVE